MRCRMRVSAVCAADKPRRCEGAPMTPSNPTVSSTEKIDLRKIKPTGVEAYTYKHGHTLDRKVSPTYSSWAGMLTRCTNPNYQDWKYYGGKGITVCQEWRESFAAFLRDMGIRPKGKTLDRFPNNQGNYEPNNCRWATPFEQQHNKAKLTHCRRGHSLTGDNGYPTKDGRIQCKICKTECMRRLREKWVANAKQHR